MIMNKNKEFKLPKKDDDGKYYLSYSQINTWKRSPREYIRQYFFGDRFTGNAYTEFGTLVGEALENNNFEAFNDEERKFLETIPRYDEFERKINWDLGDFKVIGFIDTNSKDLSKMSDYKTGNIKTKAAEYADPKYTQLDIYSAAIKQETNRMPKNVSVTLIDRKGNAYKSEPLTLGNKFKVIKRKITMKRLKEVEKEVLKIAQEISDHYNVFLKLNV